MQGGLAAAIACLLTGAWPAGAAADPAQRLVAAAGCEPSDFFIVLDVGHTAEAPGATSARGTPEHVFNLRLAERVHRRLSQAGFRTDLQIMHGAGRAQLLARAAQAKARRPDLLLSVHHDDVQPRYYSQWTYQGRARRYSDRFAGYSLFVSLANRCFRDSLAFAVRLGSELKARGLDSSSHHAEDIPGERRPVIDRERGVFRYDGLIVLARTDVPAVLLEAGVIVNRAEELALAAPPRQDAIADAVLAAVRAHCADRPQRGLQ